MKKLTAHLQYSLWIYLLIAVVSISLWVTVFGSLAAPADNERVSILFFGSGLDSAALEADLTKQIGSLTEQPIQQITVDAISTRDQAVIGQLLPTRGSDADLIVLSEEMLKELSCQTFFPSLPTEKLASLLPQAQYFQEDGVPYGIRLTGADNRFCTFYTGGEVYYIFCSSQSVNLGGLTENGNPGDDAALAVLKYLLE